MTTTRGAVRQASLREHNLALVLQQVAERTRRTIDGDPPATRRPPSRADLAAVTGLTRATVSALVDDLINGRLLTEVDPAPRTGAGRPAQGLVLATTGPAGLGLEINVDYLAACVLDLTGAVRYREVRRVDLRPLPPADVLARVADLAAVARSAAERQDLTLAGTALAVPGLVTPAGVVHLAPNLGWRGVDVAGPLATTLAGGTTQVLPAGPSTSPTDPLTLDNEANLAALGELHAGAPDTGSFLYVSGEVGIGAGIVLDGVLFRGARGWSGELGHLAIEPAGRPCRCGARGCLEQYAGQEAILSRAGLAGKDGDPPVPAHQAIDQLAELAGAGDSAATAALAEAGGALGVAIAGVINLLDLETVVLGGSYAPLAPWLCPPVEAELRGRVLTAAWSPIVVRPALLGADAAVVGAAGSVVRAVLEQPARWLGAAR